MASVKNRSMVVRDALGNALVSKTATLKRMDTGATVASGATDGTGKAGFTGLDETLRYRIETAVGGSSTQVVANEASSPEADDFYVNTSLRTAAGATVAFGGAVSMAAALTVAAGGIAVTAGGISVTAGGVTANSGTIGQSSIGLNLVNQYSADDANAGVTIFYKSRGSVAAPTQALAGDNIHDLYFRARDASAGWQSPMMIRGVADEAITATSAPGHLSFYTTPSGSVTLAERMRITSAGLVGIGTAEPAERLHVAADGAVAAIIERASTDASAPALVMRKTRGTLAAKTIVAGGDGLGEVQWWGWDGTAYRLGATIVGTVDGPVGVADMPGALSFRTSPDGSATPVDRLRITQGGLVGVGPNAPNNGQFEAESQAAARGAIWARGAVGQTEAILKVVSSAGTPLFGIGPNGQFWTNQITASAATGSATSRLPISDQGGTFIGYIQVFV